MGLLAKGSESVLYAAQGCCEAAASARYGLSGGLQASEGISGVVGARCKVDGR